MRKWLVIAAVLLLLCACGAKENGGSQPYTVERYGRTYVVDQENQTVTYEGVVYGFELQVSGGRGYSVTFTAPDGSTGFWEKSDSFGAGGWSDDWDESVRPGDLADALSGSAGGSRERTGNPLLGLLLIAVGAFNALAPETAWYLSHGWRYKDAEPSEAALVLSRVSGAAAIIIGIICFFV